MARLSYVDPASLTDPRDRELLDRARLHGTPRPESQAIRAHVPEILRTFSAYWEATFADGLVDNRLKELCRLYVSKTVECNYCDERERTALAYTRAIAWDTEQADDALWQRLRTTFTEEQIAELGSFVSLTAGAQRFVKTLDLGHREVLGDGDAGLAHAGRG